MSKITKLRERCRPTIGKWSEYVIDIEDVPPYGRCFVLQFSDYKTLTRFMDEVGGAPHPHRQHGAVLSDESIDTAVGDTSAQE